MNLNPIRAIRQWLWRRMVTPSFFHNCKRQPILGYACDWKKNEYTEYDIVSRQVQVPLRMIHLWDEYWDTLPMGVNRLFKDYSDVKHLTDDDKANIYFVAMMLFYKENKKLFDIQDNDCNFTTDKLLDSPGFFWRNGPITIGIIFTINQRSSKDFYNNDVKSLVKSRFVAYYGNTGYTLESNRHSFDLRILAKQPMLPVYAIVDNYYNEQFKNQFMVTQISNKGLINALIAEVGAIYTGPTKHLTIMDSLKGISCGQ